MLEFNVVSRAVRLRGTPSVLEGREVRYSERGGPEVVEVGG